MKHFTLQTRAAARALSEANGLLIIGDDTPVDIWNGCQILKRDGLVAIRPVRYSGRQSGKAFIVEAVNKVLLMHIHMEEKEIGV